MKLVVELIALLLIWAGTVGSASVAGRAREMLAAVGPDRITMKLRTPAAGPLGRLDMDELAAALNGSLLAYADEGRLREVTTSQRGTAARVIGVSSTWSQFDLPPLRAGSFFTERDERSGRQVAVVGSGLAWKQFLAADVLGQEVSIDGATFRIVGVYEEQGSLLDVLRDDGDARIYVPFGLEGDGTAWGLPVAGIQVAAASAVDVEAGLGSIGKVPGDFITRDLSMAFDLGDQKRSIVLFATALVSFVLIIHLVVRILSWVAGGLRNELDRAWFWQAVRRKAGSVSLGAGCLIAAGGLTWLLWGAARFSPHVPSELMPDRLIQLDYFAALARRLIQQANGLRGFVPSADMLLAERMAVVQNLLLFLGLGGAVLFAYVRSRTTPGTRLAALAGGLVGSLLAVAALAAALGMAPVVPMRDVFILAVFSFAVACQPQRAKTRTGGAQ